jgi:hypothetical protein
MWSGCGGWRVYKAKAEGRESWMRQKEVSQGFPDSL